MVTGSIDVQIMPIVRADGMAYLVRTLPSGRWRLLERA